MDEIGLVTNRSVLLRDGVVAAVGSPASVRRAARTARLDCIDARGKVVLPGFVDSHTHALFVGTRVDEYDARIAGASYEEIARAGGGIQASAARLRRAPFRELVRHLTTMVSRFLEHGTTTAEIKSGYGLEPAQEMKMLRAIHAIAQRDDFDVVPTLLCHDVPAPWRAKRAEFITRIIEALLPRVARLGLAECFDVFCDRGYWTLAESRTLLAAAARAGLTLKIHAEQLSRSGAARVAAQMKAVSADHLDHLTVMDMAYLRQHGTIATLLPGSTLHLGDVRYPAARRLIERQVPVALATNFNPGSSPTINMQMILSLACSQMGMTPRQAIVAATINGAYAATRGHRVGSVEVGKQADLVLMDVRDYREIPYFFGMNHCEMVIKRGGVVYCKGSRGS